MFLGVRRRGGEWGRKREREKHRCEKHWLIDTHTHPKRGLNPQPRYVVWLVIEPTTFCYNQLNHPTQVSLSFAGPDPREVQRPWQLLNKGWGGAVASGKQSPTWRSSDGPVGLRMSTFLEQKKSDTEKLWSVLYRKSFFTFFKEVKP